MKTTISFTPTLTNLEEIKLWLIAEDEKSGDGFYCNWKQIKRAFDQNKMAVIFSGAKPIGFVTWSDWENVQVIEITEIKPRYRSKGYGKLLIEELSKYLAKNGAAVLRLHCQPSSSELIWKKIGFAEFPIAPVFDDLNSPSGKHLYKFIVNATPKAETLVFGEKIELWDVEPYQIKQGIAPKWIWEISYEGDPGQLSNPIISPAHRDWMIRWSSDGNTIAEGKVKHFLERNIDVYDFIIINKLMAPQNFLNGK